MTGAAMSGVVAGETHKAHTGIPVLHAGSHFRHGLLQLMIHTIDPLHDGKFFSTDDACKKGLFKVVISIFSPFFSKAKLYFWQALQTDVRVFFVKKQSKVSHSFDLLTYRKNSSGL